PVRRFSFTLRTWRALKLAAVGLMVFGASGGYAWLKAGERYAEAKAQVAQMQAELARMQAKSSELAQALDKEREKARVYAQRIGFLQAEIARLDALGGKLAAHAEIDRSVLDTPPAFGGAAPSAQERSSPDLDGMLAELDREVQRLDLDLALVEARLMQESTLAQARPHLWPTRGGWISSGFGKRIDPFTGVEANHYGVDIANRVGAPVFAASRGVVVYAGPMKDFGQFVEIDHGFGYRTRYGHLSNIVVKPGQIVEAGQLIGRIGSSGRSTGPHLHFEVHRYHRPLNPQAFLGSSPRS
ncbi:MAG: M23 family peptidase, partial [Zetaproteobacteria bacterium]